MKKEFNPCNEYSAQLLKLLDKCRTQSNPAMWLYKNNARSVLFMLESITRLIYKSTGDKTNKKWHKTFRLLEDRLGKIDHYHQIVITLTEKRSVAKPELEYLIKKREKATIKLNTLLSENDFYKKFMVSFCRSNGVNILNNDMVSKFKKRIKKEIYDYEVFFDQHRNGFNDLETQVHEIRRKMRWLSLYAASLQGIIALKQSNKKFIWEKQLLNNNSKNNIYNKISVKKGLSNYIFLNKSAFIALNEVVEKLGHLKDIGLTIQAMENAIMQTKGLSKAEAYKIALEQMKSPYTIEKILLAAHDLLYKFIKTYKIHKALMPIR